jgi:hypothetical protein
MKALFWALLTLSLLSVGACAPPANPDWTTSPSAVTATPIAEEDHSPLFDMVHDAYQRHELEMTAPNNYDTNYLDQPTTENRQLEELETDPK